MGCCALKLFAQCDPGTPWPDLKASDKIHDQLPYLRRYARAVTGPAAEGGQAVEQMLEALPGHTEEKVSQVTSFRALDTALAGRSAASPLPASLVAGRDGRLHASRHGGHSRRAGD
ncbi:hypothetical protein [Hyphomonas sp.]|uniref:hypothetical protein n=1 Tax=Hyphomonas sp. TaxID=87 RepID=UPI0037BE23BC